MYSPTDLKKNIIIQLDNQPYRVTDYSQKVMGRGGSIVNVKLKNLMTGAVIPKTFKGQDKIQPASVDSRKVQYLYTDGDDYHFMDPESFDQFQLAEDMLGDSKDYLSEGDEVMLQSFDERIISVDLPNSLYLEVMYTEDVVKGDTTSSVLKDARLSTGLVVKVPSFIKTGDILKIDTREGSYIERKK